MAYYQSISPETIQLKHEFTMIVAGPTKSGKTEFVKQLIEWNNQWIHPPPDKIVWCYREWQPAYEILQREHQVHFIQNLPEDDEVLVSDPTRRHLLIFDDMMGSKALDAIVEWFARKAHHRNTSVIYITQNLFERAKQYRTISLNAHYLVLFKNPRDKSQVTNLSRQLELPGLNHAYQDATNRPHGYLLIDLTSSTPDHLRLRSELFHPWYTGGTVLYTPYK